METGNAAGKTWSPLAKRHAVVTGAGRGIGLEIARVFVAAGADVTLMGRDRARLESAASEAGAGGVSIADVTDPGRIREAFGEIASRLGPVAILVNNAGAAESAAFLRADDTMWSRMFEVNLMGAVRASRAVLPAMVEGGFGRIVNIASTAGLKGYAYVSAYCAAKHAMIGFTRSLAMETAGTGVTVNAICPGYTNTDLVATSVARIRDKTGRAEEEIVSEMVKQNPMQRLIRPEEVAEAALWLAQPASGAMTGVSIPIAGGEVM